MSMMTCQSKDDLIASRRFSNRVEFEAEIRQVINKFFNTRLMEMDDISDALLDMTSDAIEAAKGIKEGKSVRKRKPS